MRKPRTDWAVTICVPLVAALVVVPSTQPARGEARAEASCGFLSQSTVPAQRRTAIARGFNLPGWLDGANTRRPDPAMLETLHRRGFTHVRLPVTPERLMPEFSAEPDIARDRLELDAAIDRLMAIGFAVSLDLHPGSRLERMHVAEPERAFGLLDALWRQLSRRYAGRPADRLFFEVLNEPAVSRSLWEQQGPRLAQTIRNSAPQHTIVFGGTNFQRIDALPPTPLLKLPNVIYAVHFYAPMVFTHQGLDWSDDPLRYLHGVPFPSSLSDPVIERLLRELRVTNRDQTADRLDQELRQPWDLSRIAAEMRRAAAWGRQHGVPVVLNEFGVLAWKAPAVDRLRWLEAVRRSAEQACIGWTHWDYADAFGFVRRVGDREIADEAVLRALLAE